jgi:dihydrofolate synthase/folylpolyglutamate synthase
VEETALIEALEFVEHANADEPITVFEVTTAVALHLFATVPADLLVLEVGLGGRFDATNVVDRPAATAITSISMDHMEFLGDTLGKIAFEKAGIIKPGVPCATGAQPADAFGVIAGVAREQGAPLRARGDAWDVARHADGALTWRDGATIELPPPSLRGPHQADNAGIAVAALRAWNPPWLNDAALREGITRATWPARMQRLEGRLAATLPQGWELWLDGGHNAGAGLAIAAHLAEAFADRPAHLLVGMKDGKQSTEFLRPIIPHATTLWAIAEPEQHLAMPVEAIIAASGGVARAGGRIEEALARVPRDGPSARVLICGSLYLAGEVLKLDRAS